MCVLVILYAGVLLTGSRTTFLMSVVIMLFLGIIKKELRKYLFWILVGSLGVGIVYVILTDDFQNIGRFLTISPKSSTLIGRILYWQDGLRIIKDHPLGLGASGYKYLQGQYQTGVYSIEFIHNELLQMMLDIGVIPAIMFIASVIKSFFCKNICLMKKTVILVILVHSMTDFDLQFLAIFYILILCMDLDSILIEGEYERNIGRKTIVIGSGIGLVWFYFSIPLLLYYMDDMGKAVKCFPIYTEAEIRMMENSNSLEEAEQLADNVLKYNDSVTIAYDVKALAAAQNGDYQTVIKTKDKAIMNSPYMLNEYINYLELLSEGIRNESDDVAKMCRDKMLQIPQQMQMVLDRTSYLGKRIKDKPNLELPKNIEKYLENLRVMK